MEEKSKYPIGGIGNSKVLLTYLDDEHLDQNKDKIATGKKVLLSKYDVSEDIKSIEVYVSFIFKLKFKILVNGNIIYQD